MIVSDVKDGNEVIEPLKDRILGRYTIDEIVNPETGELIIGKNPAEELQVSKDGGKVDAITASTITSRAFLLAVNNAYKAYKA